MLTTPGSKSHELHLDLLTSLQICIISGLPGLQFPWILESVFLIILIVYFWFSSCHLQNKRSYLWKQSFEFAVLLRFGNPSVKKLQRSSVAPPSENFFLDTSNARTAACLILTRRWRESKVPWGTLAPFALQALNSCFGCFAFTCTWSEVLRRYLFDLDRAALIPVA